MNHKRIYCLYWLEGLGIRPKKPRRHVTMPVDEWRGCQPRKPNDESFSDIISDQLINDRRLRSLIRDSRAIEVMAI